MLGFCKAAGRVVEGLGFSICRVLGIRGSIGSMSGSIGSTGSMGCMGSVRFRSVGFPTTH